MAYRKKPEPETQLVISAPAPAPGGNLISAPRLRLRNTACQQSWGITIKFLILIIADPNLFNGLLDQTSYLPYTTFINILPGNEHLRRICGVNTCAMESCLKKCE